MSQCWIPAVGVGALCRYSGSHWPQPGHLLENKPPIRQSSKVGVGGAGEGRDGDFGEAGPDTDISEGLCKFKPSLESSGEMKNKNKMATPHAPLRPLKRRLLKWKCKINQKNRKE